MTKCDLKCLLARWQENWPRWEIDLWIKSHSKQILRYNISFVFDILFYSEQAENIGGVRRVLKPSSEGFEVVEVKYKEKEIEEAQISNDNNQSNSNKEDDLQKERDLIAELLKVKNMH